ncbi:DUF3795 domain-containing protein [Myxococcota bacterium]|nr:DUF3795 domain-containing protein [Myxococcota bacterium]MBU1379242.1 DUF3795 domain-containing protein [Myxococcota bacterium]MBU1496873.1 DUF3795 domain-containing protein [Myxococcota bacterium]
MELSVCGVDCSECEFFKNQTCAGCNAIKGKVFWTTHLNTDVCPIYSCVSTVKNVDDCGKCGDVPCKIWKDLRDPAWDDQQHAESIRKRLDNLKTLK